MVNELSLLEAEKQVATTIEGLKTAPVFTEAVQIVCQHLDIPIGIVGTIQADTQWLRAAVGLSYLGPLNALAMTSQMPSYESFCLHVMQNAKPLAISDAQADPLFAQHLLAQKYKIRAYLGVPLLGEDGHCLGTLAVMDLAPRAFDDKAIEFLTLTARWCMSEYARLHSTEVSIPEHAPVATTEIEELTADRLRQELLSQCIQNLRAPLTTILGMTGMINREVYGPLSPKQKEYLEIVAQCGQDLLCLSDEMLDLSLLTATSSGLAVTATDIQWVCQQTLHHLHESAQRFEQQLHLSMEPGQRYYSLDKEKVRLMLHYLVVHFMEQSPPGSQIHLHISHVEGGLGLSVWATHAWLQQDYMQLMAEDRIDSKSKEEVDSTTCLSLGLQFSQQLAQLHGGRWNLEKSPPSGCKGTIFLPAVAQQP